MALMKLSEYFSNNEKDLFGGHDITNFSVYAEKDGETEQSKLGSVKDILVDAENGLFRYFIVDTGFWVFGKSVLLPVGMAQLDYSKERLYIEGLTKKQVEDLPKFTDDMTVDYGYEERVRSSYSPLVSRATVSPTSAGDAYDYQQEPYFYSLSDPAFRDYQQRIRDRKTAMSSPHH